MKKITKIVTKNRKMIVALLIAAVMLAGAVMTGCSAGVYTDRYYESVSDSQTGLNDTVSDPIQPGAKAQQDGVKLVKTVDINAETKDFENAVKSVTEMTEKAGGYVEASSVTDYGYDYRDDIERSAAMTLRIPADKLDEFTSGVGELMNVYYSGKVVSDVTETYYDIQSRLEAMKAKRDALQGLLDKAENLDDVLAIQKELYAAIADVESYQTRMNAIEGEVTYSTVHLSIYEVDEYSTAGDRSYGTRVGNAFKSGWKSFGRFVSEAFVLFMRAIPFLLAFAVVIAVIVLIARASTKKGKKASQNKNDRLNQKVDQPDNHNKVD